MKKDTTTYTPGPWKTGQFHPNAVYKNGNRIALCSNTVCYTEEDTHNARLIAAAPDLLEALVMVEKWANEAYPWDKMEPLASILKKARAAIEKATNFHHQPAQQHEQ